MKLVKGCYDDYYEDENRNRWNSRLHSKELAIQKSKSLVNCSCCVDCMDCADCQYCFDCIDCQGCISSQGLSDCLNCKDCQYCYYCTKCTGCRNCKHMNGYNENPIEYVFEDIYGENIFIYTDKQRENIQVITKNFMGSFEEFKVILLKQVSGMQYVKNIEQSMEE